MSLPSEVYGDLGLIQSKEGVEPREILSVADLTDDKIGKDVWVRAFAASVRGKGKCGFILLRTQITTIQACVFAGGEIPNQLAKYVQQIPVESLVEVYGTLTATEKPVTSATKQNMEIQIKRCHIVSRAKPTPIVVADCQRVTEEDDEGPASTDKSRPHVTQKARLDNRVLDLRTTTNQAIFRIQSKVCQFFREYLLQNGFQEIHTPKLIATASEGGSEVFEVKYFNGKAYLAQSPQLYKQMCVVSGMPRVFEIGPVFRAENSFTHRHLTEFTGLDCEMEFKLNYHEALNFFKDLLATVFNRLLKECRAEIDTVKAQFPSEDVVINPVIIKYPEAVAMIREAGLQMEDYQDLSSELEKKLGELVKAKYNTDFFILDKFPSAVRPFYTMPDPENPNYSNSYDMFLRGEEIVSGAQRIHDSDLLLERAAKLGVNLTPIQQYVDCFKYGAPPHAGLGCGLDRITFLFLGLKNVRRGSLFPRDPSRLTP
ncbi:Aspartate--tRNA ligase, cytoplasmic [Histomonas meleagridis]|uniref:Aspartate--tRNA ligase, cytoplasmic n=1 Tax=Histomonas meleagridis TaxID=135588 RepID=UPI0035597BD4|nr:Aspartate--tRNA ligase, cytoplasmic [Histomonas meleagridis]KAH0803918.1 Aspartate--tRNA ligase, cytoplasmic [Histomonas meleagridis]